jgi:flagellar hook protein FlgE
MIRSMFTAINSLYVHQQYLDVISDNLANVNTPGFKSSYMSFKNQFAQTLSSGAAPTTSLGGTNPIQIGLGAVMGTVSPIFTSGALESTGRTLDLAISGDGFFVYNYGETPYYSRDGGLQMDSEGYLVNGSTGARLQGWQADMTTNTLDTTGAMTSIKIPIDSSVALQTTKATITGNLDASLNYVDPSWTVDTTTGSRVMVAGDDPLGSYSTTFGIYDSLGNMQTVTLTFVRVSSTGSGNSGSSISGITDGSPTQYWTVHLTGLSGSATSISTTDASSVDLLSLMTAGSGVDVSDPDFYTYYPALQVSTGDPSYTPIGALKFDENGQVDYDSQVVSINIGGAVGADTRTVTFDLSALTALNADSSVAASDQNGLPGGSLSGFTISDTDGTIYGTYSNGSQRVIGQVAIATFSNPSGLNRIGDNMYSVGLNSGLARIGTAGSGDKGTIASGYEEASNVDMSREFANMILAQRGFEASSRIITTSDEMLQQLVNLGK